MSKQDRQKERLDNVNTGGHLGGTKFGQQPGAGDANHAKPPKQVDEKENPDDKK